MASAVSEPLKCFCAVILKHKAEDGELLVPIAARQITLETRMPGCLNTHLSGVEKEKMCYHGGFQLE